MNKRLLALYSAGHFWVDLSCAFLLFRILAASPDMALCLLVYNFCAFALQMPLGLLADRLDRNGAVSAVGCLLTALAYLMQVPMPAAVTAGVGNALFHLGGGIDVLNGSRKKSSALGVFVAPGAAGLFLGTLWGKSRVPALWTGPAGLLIFAAAILLCCRRRYGPSFRSGNAPFNLAAPAGCARLVPLFLVVVLRSYMGMNQTFSWKGEGQWALALMLALALGKAAGGFLMDAAGPRKAAAGSLMVAAALYLASALPLPGTLAVFFFNMTMPVTLWEAARVMPGAKGFTFGLLTFGLFLGYLPGALGLPGLLAAPWTRALAALTSLMLLWPALEKKVAG